MDKSPSSGQLDVFTKLGDHRPGQQPEPEASSSITVNIRLTAVRLLAADEPVVVVEVHRHRRDGRGRQEIGDVSDVLFDQQGKIEAYVVGVGGFLGIGAKDVALAPSAFQPVKDNNNNERLKLSMTKDQLEKAPAFERKQEPRATTGAGSPSSGMGSPRPVGAPVEPRAKLSSVALVKTARQTGPFLYVACARLRC